MEKLLLYPNFLFSYKNEMISNILMFLLFFLSDVIYKSSVMIMAVSLQTVNANSTKLPSADGFWWEIFNKTTEGRLCPIFLWTEQDGLQLEGVRKKFLMLNLRDLKSCQLTFLD